MFINNTHGALSESIFVRVTVEVSNNYRYYIANSNRTEEQQHQQRLQVIFYLTCGWILRDKKGNIGMCLKYSLRAFTRQLKHQTIFSRWNLKHYELKRACVFIMSSICCHWQSWKWLWMPNCFWCMASFRFWKGQSSLQFDKHHLPGRALGL